MMEVIITAYAVCAALSYIFFVLPFVMDWDNLSDAEKGKAIIHIIACIFWPILLVVSVVLGVKAAVYYIKAYIRSTK